MSVSQQMAAKASHMPQEKIQRTEVAKSGSRMLGNTRARAAGATLILLSSWEVCDTIFNNLFLSWFVWFLPPRRKSQAGSHLETPVGHRVQYL